MQTQVRNFNTFLNYFYLFWIIIYAGSATVFARSIGDIRTIGNAYALILTGIVIGQNRISFNRSFILCLVIFSLYAAITFILNRRVSPLWLCEWIIWLTIAYCLCQIFGNNLFSAYERIICLLCLISIPLWILYVIVPEFATSLVQALSFSSAYEGADNVLANMIVFTVPPHDFQDNFFKLLTRNSGFAWEPGAFASFICMALFCNAIRTNLKLKHNWQLLILVFTLLTTQSTTGYIILVSLLIMWLFLQKKFLPGLLIIPLIVGLVNLPFVGEKFQEEAIDAQNFTWDSANGGALGRIMSFKFDFQEYLRHPVFGLGGYSKGTWLQQQGYEDIVTISGIGKLLSMFGTVMTILFLVMLIRSARYISESFSSNNGYILILVILGIMISYNLWTQPIFIAFWMYGVFHVTRQKYVFRIMK